MSSWSRHAGVQDTDACSASCIRAGAGGRRLLDAAWDQPSHYSLQGWYLPPRRPVQNGNGCLRLLNIQRLHKDPAMQDEVLGDPQRGWSRRLADAPSRLRVSATSRASVIPVFTFQEFLVVFN